MQRYGFKYIGGNESIWDGEQPNGEYCLYSDYEDLQSALAASEKRVKELEAALRAILPPEIPNFETEKYTIKKSDVAAARKLLEAPHEP